MRTDDARAGAAYQEAAEMRRYDTDGHICDSHAARLPLLEHLMLLDTGASSSLSGGKRSISGQDCARCAQARPAAHFRLKCLRHASFLASRNRRRAAYRRYQATRRENRSMNPRYGDTIDGRCER